MKFHQRFVYLTFALVFVLLVLYRFSSKISIASPNVKLSKQLRHKLDNIFVRNDGDCSIMYNKTNLRQYSFQKVDESAPSKLSKFYVYSAFFDTRSAGKIVVMSVLDGYPPDFECVVWFSLNTSRLVRASVTVIPEGNGRRYVASFIICQVEANATPLFVSVVPSKCAPILNLLPIEVVPDGKSPAKIAVCVTPLNLAYNKVDQLIETMSINRIFGASHHFLYNYSTASTVDRVLAAYSLSGAVTVMPFHLPMKVHVWPVPKGYVEDVKYFGQMAALNDCLYRTMGRYQYVAFSDLDEYLVPRAHRDWKQLINTTQTGTTAWLFRNVFFKTEWPSDPDMANNRTIRDLKAMSLLKVRRSKDIEPAYQRSKLIVDPLFVDVMGVHNIWALRPGGRLHIFSPEMGLCHHYRFWDNLGDKEFVYDRNIFRLREEIVSAVIGDRVMLRNALL